MTRVHIGLGSNLGDRARAIDDAVDAIGTRNGLLVVAVSSLWETDPVGPAQGKFLNAVCEVECLHAARELLRVLHEIEQGMGRVRTLENRFGPRTIDLDILLYGNACIDESGLTVPHPRLCERAFALAPLLEINPAATLPPTEQPLAWVFSALEEAGGVQGIAVWRARTATLRG